MTTAMELESLLRDLRALMDRAEELLARADGRHELTGVTATHLKKIDLIASAVCEESGIKCRQIFSRNRTEVIACARQICMVLIRAKIGLSKEQTGRVFRRDHGTVIHAEESVNNRIATDSKFACRFAHINAEVENKLKTYADKN